MNGDDLRMAGSTWRPSQAGPPPARGPMDLAEAQRSFAGVLGKSLGRDAAASPVDRAREAAEQLVAQTFLLPMLKELRTADRTAPPFAPSQGEKQFRALMDAELAQRLVKASRFGLVDRLAQDLLKGGGAAAKDAGPNTRGPEARDRSGR